MALATSTWVAIGSAVASAAGGIQQRKQAKAATKSAKEDQEQANMIARKEEQARLNETRRQQVREERIRRATIAQQSANTGVGASSGEIGALSSLGTQIAGNQASLTRQTMTADSISALNQSAQSNMDRANESMQKAGLYDSIFSASSGIAINGLLNKPVSEPVSSNNVSPQARGKKNIFT